MWRNGAYIRVKWVDGRAVQEYIGGGVVGALTARLDDRERKRRNEARRELKRQADEWKATEDVIGAALNDMRLLTAGVLLATGHTQRKRQWRIKHDKRAGTDSYAPNDQRVQATRRCD